MRIDFSDVKSFEPIPAGHYDVIVTEIESADAKSSGLPYFKWTLTVIGGEFDDRMLFFNTSLQPQALFKLRDSLIACGATDETVSGSFEPEELLAALSGAKCMAVVELGTYEGKITNNVTGLERSSNTLTLVIGNAEKGPGRKRH